MSIITLQEAQQSLPELLNSLQDGEEVTISDHGQPIAQLKKVQAKSWPSRAGSYKKSEFWMAADFHAPLAEFKEYME